MKPLSLRFGVTLGLGAIVLAWSTQRTGDSGSATPQPPQSGLPPPASAVSPLPGRSELDALRARALVVPVSGVLARDLRDSFTESRRGHAHEAIDILAPRGTRVLAADDGTVVKLFRSTRGGLTIYQHDATSTFCYYYAHLAGYAPGLREGLAVRKGETIGYVGTTGNAPPQTPHLHFAVSKLGPEKRWWQGTAIDPFSAWAGRG